MTQSEMQAGLMEAISLFQSLASSNQTSSHGAAIARLFQTHPFLKVLVAARMPSLFADAAIGERYVRADPADRRRMELEQYQALLNIFTDEIRQLKVPPREHGQPSE